MYKRLVYLHIIH